jgi:hypothetical protein
VIDIGIAPFKSSVTTKVGDETYEFRTTSPRPLTKILSICVPAMTELIFDIQLMRVIHGTEEIKDLLLQHMQGIMTTAVQDHSQGQQPLLGSSRVLIGGATMMCCPLH